jgi:hypothetical protein
MIQRIQTLYFLIAAILIGLFLFVPYIEIVSFNGEVLQLDASGFHSDGTKNSQVLFSSTPISLLCIFCVIFIIATIFQYNRRTRQIRLSKLIILIILVLLAIIGFYIWRSISMVQGNYGLKIFLAFPVIAILFLYLANRAIMNDIKLLKSADRVR